MVVDMWRALSSTGAHVREVRVEGSGKERDLVIVPEHGERLRLIAAGDVAVETVGRVVVRASPVDAQSLRVTFSGERLVLERAEVYFDGSERDWENLWRRARMRSRPWWTETAGDELDLDWAMQARLTIVGR
jgi:hypothetical protein